LDLGAPLPAPGAWELIFDLSEGAVEADDLSAGFGTTRTFAGQGTG
jgi:hypothetical protein